MKNPIATTEEFLRALCAVQLTVLQKRMLVLHYEAPARTLTADQMAVALGYQHRATANANYGKLGSRLGNEMSWEPDSDLPVAYLVGFQKNDETWRWIMRPELARALEALGLVNPSLATLPEEIDYSDTYAEGSVRSITVNAYERSREARIACLDIHGYACCVCGALLSDIYGDVAKNFIHVHHLLQLSEIASDYAVNPQNDLRPVCPNCHAIIHRQTPPFPIDVVKAMIEAQQSLNG